MAKKKEDTEKKAEETTKKATTKAKADTKAKSTAKTAAKTDDAFTETKEAAPKKATSRAKKQATETSEVIPAQASDAKPAKRGSTKKLEEGISAVAPAPAKASKAKKVAKPAATAAEELEAKPAAKPAAKKKTAAKKPDVEEPVAQSVTEQAEADSAPAAQQELIHTPAAAASVTEQGTEGEDQMVYYNVSRFTDFDIYLFKEGKHFNLYDKLGSHLMEHSGKQGTYFAVWAPNAEKVSVMGDFNTWDRESHQLQPRNDDSGIWEGFIPGISAGMLYKYHIKSRYHLYHVEKSDPFAFSRERPPQTASIVTDLNYSWKDEKWLNNRKQLSEQAQPYSVYELHVGSWKRKPEDGNRPLTYRELADELPKYVKELGFTHVEFMPVMYHPFSGSWGYQVTGYFAAASLYGGPEDLMLLIDALHQEGIGVILDWVPSHFPSDEHGLAYFDGTHLYEHADPRKGFHPDWNSYIFNYGRSEVKSFLISNALFWIDKYHADGLRVDAVASMLYLDYSRKHDEWIPNEYGGRENLEAITFLKDFNHAVHERFPDVQTIAEESTAWPGVTNSIENGGLGFNLKWMMGWMHDTLHYFSKDPVYRSHHQGEITFSMMYAFSERFMLPLSHDEVVHGKNSLIHKMPGDEWQRFANLRTLYGYMYGHPGAKLLFMGGEFGQTSEWSHDHSLDWHLLEYGYHNGLKELFRDLNHTYRSEPSMYTYSYDSRGFEWGDYQDAHNSVISFLRKGSEPDDIMLVVCNFTPNVHHHYRLGVPVLGQWVEVLNTDRALYGGSNILNDQALSSVEEPLHGREFSVEIKLPPLATVWFKLQPNPEVIL